MIFKSLRVLSFGIAFFSIQGWVPQYNSDQTPDSVSVCFSEELSAEGKQNIVENIIENTIGPHLTNYNNYSTDWNNCESNRHGIKSSSGFVNLESTINHNFAFGGATTGSANATDIFAPELGETIRAAGLDLLGLTHQIEFAQAFVSKVNSQRDVIWLWAGANNVLTGTITGNADPTTAGKEIKEALTQLYETLGARKFIVPNLPLLGNIPLFNQDPAQSSSINQLTAAQNNFLAEALTEFSTSHPDALIIPVDIQTFFSELESSGDFENISESCFTVGLPNGLSCDNFIYSDDIHFTSAVAGKIANLVAEKLKDIPVRRLIVLGDSFSDKGSLFDTTIRTLGFGIPAPPFKNGRFADGENVIDQLETILAVESISQPFSQPKRISLEQGLNQLPAELNLLIPKRLPLAADKPWNIAILKFKGSNFCFYGPTQRSADQLQLFGCSNGLRAGQQVTSDQVTLITPWAEQDISISLFFHDK